MITPPTASASDSTATSVAGLHVLLIEDHIDLAGTVTDFLESMGCVVDYAADGMTGLHLALREHFDVIVLDVTLPGMDGLALCRELRNRHERQTPIVMMTARDELNDKLSGFESGADDYLVKPFDLPELVARIHSLVRRQRGKVVRERLCVADLTLDTGTHEVARAGQPVSLSPTCFAILELLMRRHPSLVQREELERVLWGDEPPASDTLRSQIYKLRKSVDRPFATALVQTVQGTGYRLGAVGADPSAPADDG